MGGVMATIRLALDPDQRDAKLRVWTTDVLPKIAIRSEITGVHLCRTDEAASEVKTAESRDRTDIEAAPNLIVLIEGCSVHAVEAVAAELAGGPFSAAAGDANTGCYRHEYTRLKTATAA
jgi:hypothetical protein